MDFNAWSEIVVDELVVQEMSLQSISYFKQLLTIKDWVTVKLHDAQLSHLKERIVLFIDQGSQ